jgi:hypothetical protein
LEWRWGKRVKEVENEKVKAQIKIDSKNDWKGM